MLLIVSLLVLGVLIFVHELGHFLVAKWNNVGVLEFAIGFGRKIWKKQVGETTYSIGIIPLGGYVRMVGDDPGEVFKREASATEREASDAEKTPMHHLSEEEQAPPSEEVQRILRDESRWFLKQGFWAKSAIVIAGPLFNVLFALLLAVGSVYLYGKHVPVNEPVIGELIPGYPAERSGLKRLDRVLSINGEPLTSWEDLATRVAESNGRELALMVERIEDESKKQLPVKVTGTFDSSELDVLSDNPSPKRQAKIGIVPPTERQSVGWLEGVRYGAEHVIGICYITYRGLWGMIRGEISVRKNISGPIFIFTEAANRAERGLDSLIDFMILLSVSLAILNLLPIPVLDGGHLMFFIIEALRGGPVNMRVQQVATQVGMFLLLLLMLLAVSNDVLRSFGLH